MTDVKLFKSILKILIITIIFSFINIKTINSLDRESKIQNNVYIGSVNVSNLTKQEAMQKMKDELEVYDELKLTYKNKIYKLRISNMGVNYEIEKMVDEAFDVGKNEKLTKRIEKLLKLKHKTNVSIAIQYKIDEQYLQQYIRKLNEKINTKPIDANIYMKDNQIHIEKESYGIEVDDEKLYQYIKEKVENIYIEKIEIPIKLIEPQYLYDELNKINCILGRYETKFNPNSLNRVSNIKNAVEVTSNKIIKPNEEFSFNYFTGKGDLRSKLKSAPIIINGKLEEGIGGGICQVSSTLYNAVLYSGLQVTSIKNHSIPSGYIEKGRDATISTGVIDFKFKNNLENYIFIHSEIKNDKVVSTIYGNEKDKKDIEVVTELVETIENKVEIVKTDKLYIGQVEVSQKGRIGYKVNTYRINKISNEKEFIFQSYYPPMNEIIMVGIK